MTEQVDFAREPELTLGWRIQMALDQGDLKHSDLMAEFEVSRQTVSRWCRDVGPRPKKIVLNQIAVMCGVSARWLIDGPPPNPSGPPGGGIADRRTSDYKTEVCHVDFGKTRPTSGKIAC